MLGGPPPKRDFFISRFGPSIQDSTVKDYIKDKGIANFELELVSKSIATFKSYKLSVPLDDKDKVLQPTMWPKNILVQKWRQKSSYNNNAGNLNG